ncbi:glycosyltransferase [Cohnella hongkongensis]|uniref:Glycosyltransferase n=1 Tax=Cohnella hongkongensis TaxID=178337 RepID=A0ABV9FHQ7_9BACL
MKIGINLSTLEPGKIGGMEQYLRNLIWHVANLYSEYELYLFLNSRNEQTFQEESNIRKIVVPDNLQQRDMLVIETIGKSNLDIWFCPLLNLEPKYVPIPSIVTIPDLQHEFYPEYFSPEVLEWRKRNLSFSVRQADAILTLSDFSKKTIIDTFDVPYGKVHSIHLDASKEFADKLDENRLSEIKNKYKLPKRYGLYPANTWPHKNHIKLLEAIKILNGNDNSRYNIVLTGSEMQASEQVKSFIQNNGLKDQIHFTGYIDQKDMPYIFKAADYLVFPSLFEGFGIPLVEAMKTELPIICSREGSIPEIAGESALYFDPRNAQDIADKIIQVQDESIRNDLVRKGKMQAVKFTWDNCAESSLKVFKDVHLQARLDQSTMERPLVTIVTPSFNQGKFIRETIESVLSQDYKNVEYIVMDGGSTDETVDILKSYGDRIQWVSEKDGGQADAVNKGIRKAKGEIIGWLNSDDTYLPGAISQAVRFFQRQKDVGMVYGEGYHTTENGDIIDRYPTESFNMDRLAQNCFICQPTAFFRKEVLVNVGMLNKDLHLCMDYELWMRIGKQYEIAYIPYFVATSRMYEDNKTLSRRKEVFTEIIKTVRFHYGYVPVSWVYGYMDYKLGSKRNFYFYIMFLMYFFHANRKSLSYGINELKQILKAKLKDRLASKQASISGYSDGWVSKVFITTLEALEEIRSEERQFIRISGKNHSPYRKFLKIKAYLDDEYLGVYTVKEKGEFSIAIPAKLNNKAEYKLKLIANQSFVPKKLGINDDIRVLAFVVDQIAISKEATG